MPKDFTRYTLKGYKGVFFILGTSPVTGEAERIFYIRYRDPAGKLVEEKAGRTGKPDRMTAAKARAIREDRMRGMAVPNREEREADRAEVKAETERWTFGRLWEAYKADRPDLKGIASYQTIMTRYLSPAFGDREPRAVMPLDVDRLRLTLSKKKTPGTVKNVLELLRRL